MAKSSKVVLLLVSVILAFVGAEVVNFRKCNDNDKCTVHEVRVSPCPEAAQDKPCGLAKGSNATIAFDYTPQFGAEVATANAWWTQPAMDLPFVGMDSEACKYTSCPVVSGQKQSYSYDLPIQKKFPSRSFDVKWQLLNEAGEQCCFIVQISIKNKKGKN